MRNGSGTRPLPARAGDEDKAGYDDLTVTLYTSLAVSSSAFNMTTLFKQQASAAGVTVNLNQVSANSFLRAELLHQVSFSQIYTTTRPTCPRSRRTSCPHPRSRRRTSTTRPTPTRGEHKSRLPGPVSAATPVRARLAEMKHSTFALVRVAVRGGVEPPTFRFQAHSRRGHMWLDGA
jgi:hypothetical protein